MESKKSANLVIVDKINFLENVLNVHVDHESEFYSQTIVIFTHGGLLSGNYFHPLVQMAFRRFDVFVFPFFGFMRVWRKQQNKSQKMPLAIGLFRNLNLLLCLTRGRVKEWDFANELRKLRLDEAKVIFDVLGQLNTSITDQVKVKQFVGLSHGIGFSSKGIDIPTKNAVNLNLAQARCEDFGATKVELFLHGSLVRNLELASRSGLRIYETERLSTKWLNFVYSSFKGSLSYFRNLGSRSGFVLLISRPSSKNLTAGLNPHPKVKKMMMNDLREEIRSLGKIPVILPHPTERDRFWQRNNWLFAPRWQVIDNVHYLLLIQNAHTVVTFGSGLVDDCVRLNKKVIEYRVDWSGDESSFILEGKSQFCGSREQLARALRD